MLAARTNRTQPSRNIASFDLAVAPLRQRSSLQPASAGRPLPGLLREVGPAKRPSDETPRGYVLCSKPDGLAPSRCTRSQRHPPSPAKTSLPQALRFPAIAAKARLRKDQRLRKNTRTSELPGLSQERFHAFNA